MIVRLTRNGMIRLLHLVLTRLFLLEGGTNAFEIISMAVKTQG